jgi:acyl-[acyl-carrier-protein]-phospholipid O-acyltransferase / long-chain-fatty-acid--[acyl-carrier-protein] ligase
MTQETPDRNLSYLEPTPPPRTGDSIWGGSFQSLLWTNWLTAVNDNVSRWLVIGLGKQFWTDPADHAAVLALGTVFFVLPYLMFQVPAGWLADRFSKRQVIVGCKVAEIVIMGLAILAVWIQSFEFLLAVVFLMGTQSALFAPAKIGTIPELLDEKTISSGNGLFNLATLTATVIGMSIGGWLSDFTAPRGESHLWVAAVIMIGNAIVGTLLSFFIRKMPASSPGLRFPRNVPLAMIRDFRALFANRRLFRVALGVVFFWSFAAIAQINIDAFSDESGSALDAERNPLLISLVLGVGLGSVAAGFASRGRIELGLVPWAAIGMMLFALMLAFAPQHFMFGFSPRWQLAVACLILGLLGASGGFFDVPLSSYLQDRSPAVSRGSILAACNFMLFGGVMVTTGALFPLLRTATWEPSTARLPTQYQVASLDGPLQETVRTALTAYEKFPEADRNVERIAELVNAVPAEARHAALAEMIFLDIQLKNGPTQKTKVDLAVYDDLRDKINDPQDGDSKLETKRLIKSAVRQASKQPLLSSRGVFLAMAVLTVPVILYSAVMLARQMATVMFFWLLRIVYRVKINGVENIPEKGPAVLIANHSSWLDAALLMLSSHHHVHMIAWAGNFNHWFMRWFGKLAGVILISGGPKAIIKSLREARQILDDGGVIGIFPEGGLSRNCQVKSFKPGLLKIIDGSDYPVIPIYIDEVWGTIFSYSDGPAFKKLPKHFRKGISVHIGKPIQKPDNLFVLRQEVMNLGAKEVNQPASTFISPAQMFIRACRKRLFSLKAGDSTGQTMSGGSLLMRSLILRRLLRRHVLNDHEQNVGVLIPPSVGGVVVNMALALDRRTSVNLNYSVSQEIMDHCVREAELQHVLTTEKVLEKLSFDLGNTKTLLDELRSKVTLADKIICALQAYLLPAAILSRWLGLHKNKADDLITLIFTSGSTGKPKGVMLTQRNVATNVRAIDQMISLNKNDVITGVLPFFHSFGYTISLWGAMGLNIVGTYHFSPLDARQVGKLVEQYKGTLLLATPTFLRNYLKRCTPEEFKSLEIVVVGAEKMPIELAAEFEKKFGVRPVEGYGTTELSPLVSVNIPGSRRRDEFQIDCKEGTVGRPIPNVVARVTDLDTGETLGVDQPGMLWIKGPNVMKGYLNHPEKTAEIVVDGWYNTGDVAIIDSDGFIKLTGRMSRFSKIGGEMVPHVAIEDELMRILGGEGEGLQNVAVTSVPDSRKGERLIVFYSDINKTVDELRSGLSNAGFPNLFIPSPDSFIQVETIPILGTGKLDLKGLKDLALERCPPS